jgi:hypothetical protein
LKNRTVAEACGLQVPAIETLEAHANESALKGYRTSAVLATDSNALYTFSFLTLLYFAAFSIVSARERSWLWLQLLE